VLFEELFDACDIGADDSGVDDHQRLVPIADVIRKQPPFLGRARLAQEHRLGPLDDDDDSVHLVQDEAVAAAQHCAARKGKTERDAPVRSPLSAHTRPVVPSQRDRVAGVAAGRGGQCVLRMGLLDDDQGRKYHCATGRRSAGLAK
jgi:hypothetical protein